ncbi:hypothetical protein ANCCAN_12591 [Ancylostoma caninum]|uniref:Uncharacterized protein n=1 Tax=Ancylostoma caninum TaxID=29170 RepID=A0A368GAT6_ANCCA|nr:hypothetical protein ANCCAN_12591 [Ancylostoma caninum]
MNVNNNGRGCTVHFEHDVASSSDLSSTEGVQIHRAMLITILFLALVIFQTQAYVISMPLTSGSHTWKDSANWTSFADGGGLRERDGVQNEMAPFNGTDATSSQKKEPESCGC